MAHPRLWTILTATCLIASACGGAPETVRVAGPGAESNPPEDVAERPDLSKATDDATSSADAVYGSRALTDEVSKALAYRAVDNLERAEFDDEVVLTGEEERCIAEEALAQDETILSVERFEDATLEQQAIALLAVLDCAPEATRSGLNLAISNELNSEALDRVGDEMVDCVILELSEANEDRLPAAIGFMALANEEPAPTGSVDPAADVLDTCIDVGSLFEALLEADPTMESAMDLECLRRQADDGELRAVWVALLTDPTASLDHTDSEVARGLLDSVVGCISFGEVVAAEFATSGVTLSTKSVDCIDELFRRPAVLDEMLTGSALDDSLNTDMFGCFTEDELAGLFGGFNS